MANYAQIRSMDISNGEGVGISIFFFFCYFHCKNCFNKELWNYSYGYKFNDDTIETIISLANKPYITRLSILGGDPLMAQNLDGVLHLVDKFRLSSPNKSIWLYTGYTWEQIIDNFNQCKYLPTIDGADMWFKRYEIISKCNVVVDGKFINELKDITYLWAGSTNQRVINVKETLQQNKIILYHKEAVK